MTWPARALKTPCSLSGVYPPARTSELMKNSTVSSGKSRSKISSVGVGHPRNRRRRAIVKSIASPASTPAQNPQVSVFSQSLRFDESHDELDISVKPAGQFRETA